MERTKRKRALLWVGGTTFIALVSASWVVSRSLEFPSPSISAIQGKRPLYEWDSEPGNFPDISPRPFKRIRPSVGGSARTAPLFARLQWFRIEGDYLTTLARIKEEMGEAGENKGGSDLQFWVWSSHTPPSKRGWSMAVVQPSFLKGDKPYALVHINSWRPQTMADPFYNWVHARFALL